MAPLCYSAPRGELTPVKRAAGTRRYRHDGALDAGTVI